MLKNFDFFIFEKKRNDKGKLKTIDYKLIVKDYNKKPIIYATDYKIIKIDNDYVFCKLKGIIKYEGKWIMFDDYQTDEERKIYKNSFEEGTIRRKVYNKKEDI